MDQESTKAPAMALSIAQMGNYFTYQGARSPACAASARRIFFLTARAPNVFAQAVNYSALP